MLFKLIHNDFVFLKQGDPDVVMINISEVHRKEGFVHTVAFANDQQNEEIIQWLISNAHGHYRLHTMGAAFFDNHQLAIEFKLRFG